jgi:hypothetical protein
MSIDFSERTNVNGRVFPTGVVHAAPLISEWIRVNIELLKSDE